MEKQRFGELFKRAWARGREWRLSGFLVLDSLLALVAAIPLGAALVGLALWIDWPEKGASHTGREMLAFFGELLTLLAAGLAAWLIYMWVVQMLAIGLKRETLYPATNIGRGLRSGFGRWLTVLYPLPLSVAVGILTGAREVLGHFMPLLMLAAGGGLWLLQIAVSVYMDFLYSGIAAGSPRIGFAELYRRAFTAFKNGWGRWLLWALCICGLAAASFLTAIPAVVAVVIGVARNHEQLLTGGIVALALWAVVMIAVWIRANVVSSAFFMYLYIDASGAPPELDE